MGTAPGTEGEGRVGPDPTVCALIRALGLVLINKTLGPGLEKLAQVQKEESVCQALLQCQSDGSGRAWSPRLFLSSEQRQLLHSSLGMAGP